MQMERQPLKLSDLTKGLREGALRAFGCNIGAFTWRKHDLISQSAQRDSHERSATGQRDQNSGGNVNQARE